MIRWYGIWVLIGATSVGCSGGGDPTEERVLVATARVAGGDGHCNLCHDPASAVVRWMGTGLSLELPDLGSLEATRPYGNAVLGGGISAGEPGPAGPR
jgi:hypothetical protein